VPCKDNNFKFFISKKSPLPSPETFRKKGLGIRKIRAQDAQKGSYADLSPQFLWYAFPLARY
jgi:hypothetical protein